MSQTITHLVEKNIELLQKNAQIKQLLNEVLEGIFELLTRPYTINLFYEKIHDCASHVVNEIIIFKITQKKSSLSYC